MSKVTLREITGDTVRQVTDLSVTEHQNSFVAPNAVSIAQAYFEPKAWFRAVYADDEPVGFAMLYDDPDKPEYYLWRFMIAADHQSRGFGKQAMELVIDHVRNRPNARELLTSYVPAEGGPEHFYRKLGFVDTGKVDDGEVVIRLEL